MSRPCSLHVPTTSQFHWRHPHLSRGLLDHSWGNLRLSDHAIHGVEQLVPKSVQTGLAALADLYEVVNEDIRVADRALEGPIGRRSRVLGFGGKCDNTRDCG